MRLRLCVILTGLLIGYNAAVPVLAAPPPSLKQAQELLKNGELYRARKVTEAVLELDPQNPEAQRLMAEILDREIERHKDVFESKAFEELTPKESKREVKVWLERSQALLEVQEYEQALEAAENVFLFDSMNADASRLIDKIRKEAIKSGKEQLSVQGSATDAEVSRRVTDYYEEAETAILQGKWGAAQFAVHKMLLLEPDNDKALKLKKQIQEHLGSSPS